jgi:hypothetical protein
MANKAPATLTITSTTGPGQAITSAAFTDVNNIEFDFLHNIVKVTREGSAGTQIYDYSAMATTTFTISAGRSTVVISS